MQELPSKRKRSQLNVSSQYLSQSIVNLVFLSDRKCEYHWFNTTAAEFGKDRAIYSHTFVAVIQGETASWLSRRVCRALDQDNVGYFQTKRGCVYTFGNSIGVDTSFEMLNGKGLNWVVHHQGANPPANAFVVGSSQNTDFYLGRCNNHDTAFIGKITGNSGKDSYRFSYDFNETVVSDCETHDILLC